jgi:hypothetical protein
MVELETHGEEIPTLAIDVDLPGPPSTPRSVHLPEPLNAVTLEEVLKTQKHDKWCLKLRSRLLMGTDAVNDFFVDKEGMLCLSPY